MADDEREMPQDEGDNRGATEEHGGNAQPETDPTRQSPKTAEDAEAEIER